MLRAVASSGSSGNLTAPVTITGIVGSSALTINDATQTTSKPALDMSQTWNNVATTFTGLKFNVTDTASASASLLLDLQRNGSSVASVASSGDITGRDFYTGFSRSIYLRSTAGVLSWNSGDLIIGRNAAASLRLGAADAASPVAQTLGVQSVVAGTSNTAGSDFTIKGSAGTGSAAGGSIIFQVAPAGSSGTSQNAFVTALTIDSAKKVSFAGAISFGTHSAIAAETVTGYITITDAGGTTRKLAVVS